MQAAATHWAENERTLGRDQAAGLVTTLAWRGIGYVPQVGTGSAAQAVSRGATPAG